MRYLIFALALGLFTTSCVPPPPNLTPQATAAWYGTRAVKDLDVLRDAAIDANAQVPPLLSTDTTRQIVLFHESAVKTIQSAPAGWKTTVLAALDQLIAHLSATDQATLRQYLTLARVTLSEVAP